MMGGVRKNSWQLHSCLSLFVAGVTEDDVEGLDDRPQLSCRLADDERVAILQNFYNKQERRKKTKDSGRRPRKLLSVHSPPLIYRPDRVSDPMKYSSTFLSHRGDQL